MKLPEIIGIAGTNASGKDTLAHMRAEISGCQHVTVSDILRRHLITQGIPLERKNLSDLSRQWRQETGDYGTLVTRTISAYLGEKALMGFTGLSVVSLRHPQEAERIKDHDGKVIWIDADPITQYTRISSVNRSRIDDNKSFEEFLAEEEQDMNPGEDNDPARVNMSAVKEIADIHITNNYSTLTEYRDYLADTFEM